MDREKTMFEICNVCMNCEFLRLGDCKATKEEREKRQVNSVMTCEDIYQDMMWWDHILHDPEEIKKRQKLHRELSHMSVEDWLRPFNI